MLKGYVAETVEQNIVALFDFGRSDPMVKLIKMAA
jgi:hypothetical protein